MKMQHAKIKHLIPMVAFVRKVFLGMERIVRSAVVR